MSTDKWATSKSTQLSTKVWVKLLLLRIIRFVSLTHNTSSLHLQFLITYSMQKLKENACGNLTMICTRQRLSSCLLSFSDFSVGFCINEEKGYLLPTLARKITCRRFD